MNLDLASLAAGMTILVSIAAAIWFVVAMALRPTSLILERIEARLEKHEAHDDARFARLEARQDDSA